MKTKVIGIGRAGGNVVNHITRTPSREVRTVAVDTDADALSRIKADTKLRLTHTHGLSAGGDPEVGREAALAQQADLEEVTAGADLVIIVAGLGGGTGSTVAREAAQAAKANGAVVVAIVIMPFGFEGPRHAENAEASLNALRSEVDVLAVVSNDHLAPSPQGSVQQAMKIANQMLAEMVVLATQNHVLAHTLGDVVAIKAAIRDALSKFNLPFDL